MYMCMYIYRSRHTCAYTHMFTQLIDIHIHMQMQMCIHTHIHRNVQIHTSIYGFILCIHRNMSFIDPLQASRVLVGLISSMPFLQPHFQVIVIHHIFTKHCNERVSVTIIFNYKDYTHTHTLLHTCNNKLTMSKINK